MFLYGYSLEEWERSVELRKLRYFAQVVDSRSLSRAAKQLNVAQPALSKSIQALERDYDIQLLRRSAHGTSPTEAGERLYEHCQIIFQQVDRARLDVRASGNRPSGQVVVGMPQSIASVLGLPLLLAVTERLPEIRLELLQDHSHQLSVWLRNERVNFAVMANPRSRADLEVEQLLTEELFFVTRDDGSSPAAAISLQEATTYAYILPGSPNGLRAAVEGQFRARGLSLTVHHEVDAIGLIPRCVEAGLGATVLPGGSLSDPDAVRRLQIRRFETGIHRTLVFARRTSRPVTPAVTAVLAVTADVCRGLVTSGRWRGGSVATLS